ncbi:hypothetical protein [Nocardioides sp. LHG3406-4]|uniref:hypothetical protein n=1 Tax=Nocardioides sp. LHG3406-4 TaxID=2804575 RepID=UPI003CEC844B
MPKNPAGRPPELATLLAMDPVELAAEVLVRVFTPVLDDSYPQAKGLAQTLADLGSVPLSAWTWNPSRPHDGAIARLTLELVLIWERAGVAARGVFNESNEVVLLMRGEALLRLPDARRAVEDELRSSAPAPLRESAD